MSDGLTAHPCQPRAPRRPTRDRPAFSLGGRARPGAGDRGRLRRGRCRCGLALVPALGRPSGVVVRRPVVHRRGRAPRRLPGRRLVRRHRARRRAGAGRADGLVASTAPSWSPWSPWWSARCSRPTSCCGWATTSARPTRTSWRRPPRTAPSWRERSGSGRGHRGARSPFGALLGLALVYAVSIGRAPTEVAHDAAATPRLTDSRFGPEPAGRLRASDQRTASVTDVPGRARQPTRSSLVQHAPAPASAASRSHRTARPAVRRAVRRAAHPAVRPSTSRAAAVRPLPQEPGGGGRAVRRGLLVGGGVVGLVAVGVGAWAAYSFLTTGPQPAEALPAKHPGLRQHRPRPQRRPEDRGAADAQQVPGVQGRGRHQHRRRPPQGDLRAGSRTRRTATPRLRRRHRALAG